MMNAYLLLRLISWVNLQFRYKSWSSQIALKLNNMDLFIFCLEEIFMCLLAFTIILTKHIWTPGQMPDYNFQYDHLCRLC